MWVRVGVWVCGCVGVCVGVCRGAWVRVGVCGCMCVCGCVGVCGCARVGCVAVCAGVWLWVLEDLKTKNSAENRGKLSFLKNF